MSYFFEYRGITKTYPGVKALEDVSFGVRRGAVHGLMGENGAGKSTLIRILSGDQQANAGAILIDGAEQKFASVRDASDNGVMVVHQELQLVPDLTVAENLCLGRFPSRAGFVSRRRMIADVQAVLDDYGINVDAGARVSALPLGARQMVEVAKAAMVKARVIALDEPTSSLSSRESEVLFRMIARLKAQGTVILYVSHRMDEIFQLCDSMTVLRDGRLAAHHDSLEGVTRAQIVSEMVGREISDIWNWRARPLGEERLVVDGLAGAKLSIPGSFTARKGEILGFFGLIGAGRSELMRLIYGADPARTGRVMLEGDSYTATDPRQSIRRGIAYCSEDRKHDGILNGRSVEENITISARRLWSKGGFLRPGREAEVAEEQIRQLRVRTPSRFQDIANLSGGNQQKVILGRWLAEAGLRVLIVDEPTRGIDVGAKSEIYDLLYKLAEQGMTILVVSSELPEVMGICDRVLVMCQHRISAEFTRDTFSEQALLAAALPDGQNHSTAA
ncbi:L-arabinose ABC transporter ATP-binding protein AraG [Pseudogemmobacter bohemicus]|uniref:L-arabinose ABC transporter ATP-binding protein AraG n=1 Tax=Pseudogemmobacter bohemicus TaxID=2250708 RepID=UPI000DD2E977|nr:L-arabinose ABC transporter ATP-binding protein AraG [Pseudogemmobacter bohemicus]